MIARFTRPSSLFAAVVAAGIVAPATAQATIVKVENYTNDTIFVAVAYNKFKGNVVAEGWYPIKPNEFKQFTAGDASDMYMRIEVGGNEVTFSDHQTFRNWPVESSRFNVSREADDNSVRVLKWGNTLQNSRNIEHNGALPNGWNERRFFRINAKSIKLQVNP